jgi:hypothetical protein
VTGTGGMHPAAVISTGERLAVFLGGADDSFTGELLKLVARADPGNRARLREAFPREVRAWEIWASLEEPPTAEQMAALLDLAGPRP